MLDTIIVVLAIISLLCWLYLFCGGSGFWRADHRLPGFHPDLSAE